MESDRNQTTGFPYHDSTVKSGEILYSASALEIAKQPAQTEVSDRSVFESGHREKHIGSERNPKDYSGSEKSTDSKLIQIEVGFSEPKLIVAPQLETEKEVVQRKDRENPYRNILSR
jgi:hypothetical protein